MQQVGVVYLDVPGHGDVPGDGDTPDAGRLLCLAVSPLASPGVAKLDEVRPVQGLEDARLASGRPDCLCCAVRPGG